MSRYCTNCDGLLVEADRLLCSFCRKRAIRYIDEDVQQVCDNACDQRDCCLRCVLERAAA
jgi:hypothetical protein